MGYSAYVSEVLRAGFNDVHPSQRASARSLGLTSGQTTRLDRHSSGIAQSGARTDE